MTKPFHHFSVITRRQCCVLKPLQNPHCHFESMWLKYLHIWSLRQLFIYLQQIRQDAQWAIVFNIILVFVFKNQNYICNFKFWKLESNIKLLKFWKINSKKNICFNYFHHISLSWQAFCNLDYESLLKPYILLPK